MAASPTYFDPHTLAQLEGLHLRARHLVEGFVAGLHRSPEKGYSVEFAEHRPYLPGDDLRHVDWKLFGRTGKHFIKQYEDETNLIAYLALDTSGSMNYRGPASALSKREYAQLLLAAVAWLVLRQQDAVAVATFDAKVHEQLPPSSEVNQAQHVVRILETSSPSRPTHFSLAWRELAACWKKRGVVILATDALADGEDMLQGLASLAVRRHDVLLWHIVDRAEWEFPFHGALKVTGLEGELSCDVDTDDIRQAYQHEVTDHARKLAARCGTLGVEYARVFTDEPFCDILSQWLRQRAARIR